MLTSASQTRHSLSFGPYELLVGERLLAKDGVPVLLGGRAFDILITLISQPNELISKKDLLAKVWPDVIVEESSLRFQVAALRKALGDGRDGARYITTVNRRGYCFVAPVSRSNRARAEVTVEANFRHANLPPSASLIGRKNDLQNLAASLDTARLATIVGVGGVGKTALAIALGHKLAEAFDGAVLFIDLGMLSDPKLLAATVASMLGLSVESDDATPNLIAYLRNKRSLLIFDTCEHLIEATAALVSRLFFEARQVHILTTSREALRVDGEQVYRLEPLACPPEDSALTASTVRSFPATELFIERAAASGARLDLNDVESAFVVSICRKLDGIPLGIELAAKRTESFGLQQIAALLDQRLALLWAGPRTATPRQKTLRATLDWSYGLLTNVERTVLRRLAIFTGHFTLDAILEVVPDAALDRSTVFDTIESLVAKSMVATRPIGAMMRYRLLDTTRAYVLEIDTDIPELVSLGVRHARYFRRRLEQIRTEVRPLAKGLAQTHYFDAINNVRAALEWCFGPLGDVEVGVTLAAAATPVFSSMSLLPECHRWAEQAIGALNEATCGGLDEMRLQAALGLSLLMMRANTDAASVALNRGLAIAEERGDALNQIQLLAHLNAYHFSTGDFKTTLTLGKRASAISKTIADPAAIALAHYLSGMSLLHTGNLSDARVELEAARRQSRGPQPNNAVYLGFDGYVWAGIYLARTLWLQGHPEQASKLAHQAIKDAAAVDHPITLSIVLVRAIAVFLWIGDLATTEVLLDWFTSHAESHCMGPYLTIGRGYSGLLAIHRGDAKGGVENLERALAELHSKRYELSTVFFNIGLVQGLAAIGRSTLAITLIEEAISMVKTSGEFSYLPELLRVKGSVLLSTGLRSDDAEGYFMQSLELSRRQGARAWELRTTTDLAALWASQGDHEAARDLLLPILQEFTEGADTVDFKAAQRLLATL